MTPIEKNIIVVDENGTVFKSTWLKRANGLVKKGRARWLDEKTICLACPPEQTEDNTMNSSKQAEAVTADTLVAESVQQPAVTADELTLKDLLDRMDVIRKEMLSMKDLASTMETIANQGGEDDAGHIAEATGQAFVARETTCQQQLRMLEKIYNDHFSVSRETAKADRAGIILQSMAGTLAGCSPDTVEPVLKFYGDLLAKA